MGADVGSTAGQAQEAARQHNRTKRTPAPDAQHAFCNRSGRGLVRPSFSRTLPCRETKFGVSRAAVRFSVISPWSREWRLYDSWLANDFPIRVAIFNLALKPDHRRERCYRS
jgi:hypothetical protein